MPSKKPQLKTYVETNTYEKFVTIAKKENRSTSNYLELLVLKEIERYENEHGSLKINMVKNDGTIHNLNM